MSKINIPKLKFPLNIGDRKGAETVDLITDK